MHFTGISSNNNSFNIKHWDTPVGSILIYCITQKALITVETMIRASKYTIYLCQKLNIL